MSRPTVFIDGEYGTTGIEIRARLAGRDDVELVSVPPEKRRDEAERRRMLNSVDLAILCLPDDAAREAVGLIENPNVRVLDASTVHRVHPDWAYGFPEMAPGQTERIAESRRVANPGCYPTGALGLIRPLVDADLLPKDYPVTIQAVEGYSGGGRSMIEAYESTGENRVTDPIRMYGLELAHKHVPEMHLHSGLAHRPLFNPTVGGWRQGELVQVPLLLWAMAKKVTGRDLHEALTAHYDGQRFIRVMPYATRPAPQLAPEALNGTNLMELFVFQDPSEEQALLVARLDNLGKGASGAAVQNMDLMLGLDGEQTYALEGRELVGGVR